MPREHSCHEDIFRWLAFEAGVASDPHCQARSAEPHDDSRASTLLALLLALVAG